MSWLLADSSTLPEPNWGLMLLVAAILSGALGSWTAVVASRRFRRFLIGEGRFRAARWNFLELVLAATLMVLLPAVPWEKCVPPSIRTQALDCVNDPTAHQEEVSNATEGSLPKDELRRAHPLFQLIAQRPSLWVKVLVFVLAVLSAPIAEELVFRLLFQGWLQTLESRFIDRRRQLPKGIIAWLVVAVLFAAVHQRSPEKLVAPEAALDLSVRQLATEVLLVVVIMGWLRWGRNLRFHRIGLRPKRLLGDVALGAAWAGVAVGPVLALQFALTQLFPNRVVDPIALLPFALVLGFLFWRTNRIVPGIVLHMCLNGVSVIGWILLYGG
ncbi:hypothetical protein JCM19992_21120 [Thermostilla marina]